MEQAGLSCRKTASILNRHLGWGLSASLVSRLAGHLHQALECYRHCALQDESVALIIDGVWYRFRQLFGPQRVLLAVLGLKADQSLVLLGFQVARSESALEVGRLLRHLKARGSKAKNSNGSWPTGPVALKRPWLRFIPGCPSNAVAGIRCNGSVLTPPIPGSPEK